MEGMKKKGLRVAGIGHRIKNKDNRDKRVELLQKYASEVCLAQSSPIGCVLVRLRVEATTRPPSCWEYSGSNCLPEAAATKV